MKKQAPDIRKSEANETSLFNGQFMLGIFAGATLFLFVYLILDNWGKWLTRAELIDVIPILATLLVASVSLVISLRALSEQKRMRQAGTDPVLVAHLGQRIDEPIVMTFNISNVGAGAALNVKVVVEDPPNSDNYDMITNIFNGKIFRGEAEIKVVLQNKSITYDFGMGFSLATTEPLPPFTVNLVYQDINGASYSSTHVLDVSEFSHRPANSPPMTKIWRELEKTRKAIEAYSR